MIRQKDNARDLVHLPSQSHVTQHISRHPSRLWLGIRLTLVCSSRNSLMCRSWLGQSLTVVG